MAFSQGAQTTMTTVQCSNCGADFERPESEIALKRACGQHQFFCQRACYQAHAKAQRRANPQSIAARKW